LLAALGFLAVNIHRRRQALLALRKATASLEQSESHYRGMIENSHDTFYRTDAQGFLKFISPSGARLLGYESPQEMIGRPIASLWYFPAERPDMLEIMGRDGVVCDYEVVLVRKDGSSVPVSVTSGYYHDKDEKILGVEGIFRNITERKQSEEALQESEEKYRTVADFTYNMETWRTPDDMYRYVSPSCERITGHAVAEFLIDPNLLIKITHPDDQSKVIEHFLLTRQGAGTENREIDFRILTPGGDIRWLGRSCTAVHGRDGQPLGRRESYRDITIRKQAEEEKEKIKEALKEAHDECEQRVKNRTLELQKSHEQLLHSEKLAAVGKLSASLAHEFNNPLQSVMTIIKGIGRYVPLEKKEAELVELALQECHRMKNLIANLSDFFKPTSDKLSQVDLHAIVKGLLLICKKDFHTRNITIVEKYADNIPPVMGVTDQLKQVLLNIFNNAADACEGGGVITIATEKIGENIAIHIEDNGIGISSTDITHIFEPFFTTKPELKGTGLGLSVSYGIIKKHGGRIDVKSELGKGSIFSVFLPIESVNNEQ
ncbi:MAG: PAS domain S-box-containing protein, partial [Desulforhopalus sp.]